MLIASLFFRIPGMRQVDIVGKELPSCMKESDRGFLSLLFFHDGLDDSPIHDLAVTLFIRRAQKSHQNRCSWRALDPAAKQACIWGGFILELGLGITGLGDGQHPSVKLYK